MTNFCMIEGNAEIRCASSEKSRIRTTSLVITLKHLLKTEKGNRLAGPGLLIFEIYSPRSDLV